jgi:energy-coupling factor transporter ATP-binding protein EcfA2
VKAQWMNAVQTVDVNLKTKGENEKVPIAQKGTGYRRLLMVAQLRYLAKKGNKTNTIYAIEEPETYLHPKAQDELLEALKIISDQNQIIITTHSPIFAGNVEKDFTVLVKKDDEQKSSVYYQNGEDESLVIEIINELGIKPSHNLLDTHKIFVFLEGKDDIAFWNTFVNKVYDLDLQQSPFKDQICFLFGGGNTLEDFVRIQYFTSLKAKHDKKLFLIIDSDKGNDIAKINKNIEIVDNFNRLNGIAWLLNKRYIESYYHKEAIQRIYPNIDFTDFPEVKDDTDVIKYMKTKSNVKAKDERIFNEMTKEEWQEVSNGELEGIFEKIKENL